jgi:hypothetical protein
LKLYNKKYTKGGLSPAQGTITPVGRACPYYYKKQFLNTIIIREHLRFFNKTIKKILYNYIFTYLMRVYLLNI